MAELISKDIVDLQDIEKVQFLQTLQADPAKYSAYVNEKSGRILSETVDTKRASFVKQSGDMARMMDMDHNSMAALDRTNDLASAQGMIIKQQESQFGTVKFNKDMTRRQVEINNWYYENKRETLFVLQLTLIVIMTLVVILGITSYGWITQMGADYLMAFVIIVGLGTWLYRWYYTSYIRDPRYWSQRSFKGDGKSEAPSGQICIGLDGETQSTDSKGMQMPALPAGDCMSQQALSLMQGKGYDTSLVKVCGPGDLPKSGMEARPGMGLLSARSGAMLLN
jgi:hypothetical protein